AGAAGWQAASAGISRAVAATTANARATRRCIFVTAPCTGWTGIARQAGSARRLPYDTGTLKVTLGTLTFLERLHTAADANQSWLCVGLDPSPSASLDVAFLQGIVDATHDLVCCFKPNLAFFEAHGLEGQHALRQLRHG